MALVIHIHLVVHWNNEENESDYVEFYHQKYNVMQLGEKSTDVSEKYIVRAVGCNSKRSKKAACLLEDGGKMFLQNSTTQRYIPEERIVHSHCCENLNCNIVIFIPTSTDLVVQ